jgi:hypothetical protein
MKPPSLARDDSLWVIEAGETLPSSRTHDNLILEQERERSHLRSERFLEAS